MSKQPRKQRKALYNAPAHARNKHLSASLSKDLREKLGRRSLPVRTGDTVEIVRGDYIGQQGKILGVDYGSYKVTVEEITSSKPDGTAALIPIDPSNLVIIDADLSDDRRNKNKGDN